MMHELLHSFGFLSEIGNPGQRPTDPQSWTIYEAIARTRALEPYRLYWIEEPLAATDLDGFVRLGAPRRSRSAVWRKPPTFVWRRTCRRS